MPFSQLKTCGQLIFLSFLLSLDHAFDVKNSLDSQFNNFCQLVKGRSCHGHFVTKICKRHGKVLSRSGEVQHGDKCVRDNDCSNQDSICYNGICLCRLGLYYRPTHNACLTACPVYGDKMDFYKGAGIKGHNDKILKHVSLAVCYKACLREKSFICLTFDWRKWDRCFISRSGYLDAAPKARQIGLSHWLLAQRRCK